MRPAGSKSLEPGNLCCPERQGQVSRTGLEGAALKQRKWGCRTDVAGVDRELVKMQGSKGRWTTHPQALFLFSLTRWLFHGIHKIHLSRQARGGGGRGRKRERKRECKGHHSAKVHQHKK